MIKIFVAINQRFLSVPSSWHRQYSPTRSAGNINCSGGTTNLAACSSGVSFIGLIFWELIVIAVSILQILCSLFQLNEIKTLFAAKLLQTSSLGLNTNLPLMLRRFVPHLTSWHSAYHHKPYLQVLLLCIYVLSSRVHSKHVMYCTAA